MTVETRTASDYFAMCEKIKRGEVRCRAMEVGKRNGWYVFELIDSPEPEPTTTNEVLKQLLR